MAVIAVVALLAAAAAAAAVWFVAGGGDGGTPADGTPTQSATATASTTTPVPSPASSPTLTATTTATPSAPVTPADLAARWVILDGQLGPDAEADMLTLELDGSRLTGRLVAFNGTPRPVTATVEADGSIAGTLEAPPGFNAPPQVYRLSGQVAADGESMMLTATSPGGSTTSVTLWRDHVDGRGLAQCKSVVTGVFNLAAGDDRDAFNEAFTPAALPTGDLLWSAARSSSTFAGAIANQQPVLDGGKVRLTVNIVATRGGTPVTTTHVFVLEPENSFAGWRIASITPPPAP